MKKIAAILLGLLGVALLIGISAAQTLDEIQSTEIDAAILTDVTEMGTDVAGVARGGHTPRDICGQTFLKSPGEQMLLKGPAGDDIIYEWSETIGGVTTIKSHDKDYLFTVPNGVCLSDVVVTLMVSSKWLAACQDSCSIRVLIDCECPDLCEEFCLGATSGEYVPRTITYDWTGVGTAKWYLVKGLDYTEIPDGSQINWATKEPGLYGIVLKVYLPEFRYPVKVCGGIVKIVDSPEAIITK
jgi:hypothetical protein